MSRSERRASRRLTLRLIREQPGHAMLVGLICLISIAVAVATHHVAAAQGDELERAAARRYGHVSVTVAATAEDDLLAPTFPTLSHTPERRLRWVTKALYEEVREAASALDIRLVRRVEGAAYGSDGTVRPFVAIGDNDPARAAVQHDPGDDASNPVTYTIALRRRADDAVEWHEIPPEAHAGAGSGAALWIERSWFERVLRNDGTSVVGASPVANVLVAAGTDPGNPFVVAFDLRHLVAAVEPEVSVRAWPELVGYERYAGAGSAASLLRPLVLVVAAVAIAGAVAVAMRNRVRDVVLLRTLGFDVGTIRATYVREILVGSIGAGLLVFGGLAAAAELGADVLLDAVVRRTILGGMLFPPLVAFLTVRRQLKAPLGRIRREAEQ